jgi:1,4-dihydroxy-6-naphthoate synthase
MGDGYGPVLIARERIAPEELAAKKIGIPGRLTSAALALKMWNPLLQTETYPFDEIMPAVQSGEIDAGVVIHEGQLTWEDEGFSKIVDLGVWWAEETGGMPLPLGGNLIRRDLGEEMCGRVAALLKDSIQYSLDHREAALDYALEYGRGLDRDKADRFVGMYVNELTVDYGERGRRAVRDFLDRAANERLIPKVPRLDFL